MQIAEISTETTANESVEKIQNAPKGITEFFTYVNDEKATLGGICRKGNFGDIELRGKLRERDNERKIKLRHDLCVPFIKEKGHYK